MADVLTGGRVAGGVGDTTRVLVGMRRSLARNSAGRSGTQLAGAGIGAILAVGTLLLGLVRFDDQGRSVDLLAALLLGWLIGWVMGPVALRGGGQGLRPEWFALLPIPPRRLAAGLLGASFMGVAPVITLVAFSAVVVTAARWGVAPVLVAIPGVLLELVVVVLLSRVAIAALTATLNSRRGQELGGLLMALVIAIASGCCSACAIMAQQLAEGSPPAASTALRVLPSGWAPVAVAAADRSDWLLAAGALLGLVALAGLLLLAWAALLQRNMRKGGGRTARVGHRWAGRQTGRFGLLPASPTGAVVGKELRAWRRDAERTQTLLLALLVSVLNLAVPALAWGARSLLLWVGLVAAMLAGLRAGNAYGDDGTALWLTRMTPGTERADVRGRQAAWLLAVAPVMVVLTVALTALSGEGWAWPLGGGGAPGGACRDRGPRHPGPRRHRRSGRRIPTGVPARSIPATTRTPRARWWGKGLPVRRRATNPSARADARSSHCASSTTHSSGRSSAASDSRPRAASPTRNGSGAGPALSPNATATALRCGSGRRPVSSRIGEHSCCSAA